MIHFNSHAYITQSLFKYFNKKKEEFLKEKLLFLDLEFQPNNQNGQ